MLLATRQVLLIRRGFGHALGLVVEDYEVAGLEVEAVELVAGGFGVEDVLVNDEGGALGVCGDALADLSEVVGQCKVVA